MEGGSSRDNEGATFSARSPREAEAPGNSTPAVGTTVGDYLICALLSSTLEADLFEVEHVRLHRRSRLRLFAPLAAGDAGAVERFEREARVLVALHHPNLVETHDYGVFSGRPFLVLEQVEDRLLSDHLAEHGRLPLTRAARIVAELAGGLALAHERGVVHRAIRASSVRIALVSGASRLDDFALATCRHAALLSRESLDASTAAADAIAPEQALGEEGDERSDVYALGFLLYELVVGHPPFVGDRMQRIAARGHAHDAHGTQPTTPDAQPQLAEVDAIVARCLARHPEDRYQGAGELRAALVELELQTAQPTLAEVKPSSGGRGYRELARGDRVDGRYRIESLQGRGGFGTVYRAIQIELDRPVAIKVIHPRLLHTAGAAERFNKEARALGRLRHPAIVVVHDVGTLEDGRCFIAMEWVEGVSLAQLLRSRGPLDSERALEVMEGLCQAVAAAHRAGIIHRDIKPSNVLVDPEQLSTVKLVDFGIARWLDRAEEIDETGQVMGTPETMAPEQVRGEAIDERTDVYALGVTLHWLLAGSPPFSGHTRLALQEAQVSAEPPALPDAVGARDALQPIIHRCLRKLPGERYASAEELGAELRRAGAGARAGRDEQRAARRRRIFAAAGAALLVTGALLWSALFRGGGDDPGGRGDRGAEAVAALERGRAALFEGRWRAALTDLVNARALGSADPDLPVLLGLAVQTVQPLRFVVPDRGPVVKLAFSGDGRSLAVTRGDGSIEVWSLGQQRMVFSTREPSAAALVALNRDGTLVVAGGEDGLTLWEVASGRRLQKLETRRVLIADWTRSGAHLLLVRADGVASVRDAVGGLISQPVAPGAVEHVSYDVAGDRIVVVYRGANGQMRGGALAHQFIFRTIDPARSEVDDLRIDAIDMTRMTSDRAVEYLATASHTGSGVQVGAVGGAQVGRVETGDLASVFLMRGGQGLIGVGARGEVMRWQVGSGALRYRVSDGEARNLFVSPEEDRIAVAYAGGITIYDARDGRVRAHLAHLDPPDRAAFSRDGALLATAGERGPAYVWDATADTMLAELGREKPIQTAEFVAGGVVFGGGGFGENDGYMLWRGDGASLVALGDGTLASSADGRWLNTGNAIRSGEDGKLLVRLDAPVKLPVTVALTDDGALAATSAWEGEFRIWDARSGATLHARKDPSRGYTALAFRGDGARLAAASSGGPIQIWDTSKPQSIATTPIAEIPGGSPLRWLGFAPAGAELAGIRATTLELYGGDARPIAQNAERIRFARWTRDGSGLLALKDRAGARALELLDPRTLGALWSYPPAAAAEMTLAAVKPEQPADGRWAVVGSQDGWLIVLSRERGEPLFRLRASGRNIVRVDVTRDGARVLALADDEVRIWQLPREERTAAELSAWLAERLPAP